MAFTIPQTKRPRSSEVSGAWWQCFVCGEEWSSTITDSCLICSRSWQQWRDEHLKRVERLEIQLKAENS